MARYWVVAASLAVALGASADGLIIVRMPGPHRAALAHRPLTA